MTTTVSTQPAPDAAAEMRRRGRLVLADRVVQKIASQAAAEVAATAGRSGGFLGIRAETDAGARPRVDVTLSVDSADLSLAVGIAYPGSIRRATQELRDHVTERVETLTGVDVRRVDIDAKFLAVSEGPAKAALR